MMNAIDQNNHVARTVLRESGVVVWKRELKSRIAHYIIEAESTFDHRSPRKNAMACSWGSSKATRALLPKSHLCMRCAAIVWANLYAFTGIDKHAVDLFIHAELFRMLGRDQNGAPLFPGSIVTGDTIHSSGPFLAVTITGHTSKLHYYDISTQEIVTPGALRNPEVLNARTEAILRLGGEVRSA